MRALAAIGILLLALSGPAAIAQEQTAEQAADQEGAATEPPADAQETLEQDLQEILEEPGTGESYRYDPQGRRDPFLSLIGPRQQPGREDAPPGVPGFLIEEIDLQGIIQTQGGMVALIKGPDNRGYTVRTGDKLFDGEVIRITPASVVFRQEINDPTRIERHREVVMDLKTEPEGGRS